MRRLWLLFAQTVTICLGILFIVATLRPDWLHTPQPAPATPPAPEQGAPFSFAAAVAQARPAVVNVYTSKHVNVPVIPIPADPELERLFRDIPGFSRRKESTNLGSGVIVREDGYILTNYHVIEAADAIEVALSDGRQTRAAVVGADPESDLAVLKIDLPDLRAIAFNGSHEVRTGDVVLAIGNPFGVGQTTTMGIVSALGRNRLGINIYENFIQTDAAINPGNSGGALIDTSGRLIGINTAIYSESGGSLGIGFAIPAGAAQTIMEQIIKTGTVTRGWLGIEPQDITPDLARAFGLKQHDGVIIASVLRNGPAWQAGLRVGDIVLALNGEPVRDAIGFLNQIAPLPPSEKAKLRVVREGRRMELEVRVGTRPPIPKR
ncbi:S1C family serine protease [Parapusillimonas granuli]|uniref:Trypsin-like peptidase domain-containing protein n=1 Tax=Parapusillimonas granuli TaxID=380911 RepID=A0A853GA71_9BURK|nr:trypsin-like peptidase domain-containing protein [Parapusillimonas granuli]MBB5216424.1 serine protease DegQ [Parapusillimonas granuli]MEB2399852.1 trypsin-like peptidase domain-containing protein [Alcaligenaceae bacterium]NYT51491.1 trypsin-like peptidase domain-containing protein [Parapusillimonas granuli]